ncbi:MAG TPA: hypothetical protein VGL40_12535 [Bacillota bacterium]|jgi:hypothetical protein
MSSEPSTRVAVTDCPSSPGATAAVRKALEDLRLDPVLMPSESIRRLALQEDLVMVINPAGQRTVHERVRTVADLELAGYDHAGSSLAPCVLALSPANTFRALDLAGLPLPEFGVARAVTPPARCPRPPVVVRCTGITGSAELVGPIMAEDDEALPRALQAIQAGPARPALIQSRPLGKRLGAAVVGGDGPRVFLEDQRISGAVSERAAEIAVAAFAALGCRDYAEVHLVITVEGRVLVESIDPLPRLEPLRSAFVRAMAASGLSFSDCIQLILTAAAERLGRPSTTGLRA